MLDLIIVDLVYSLIMPHQCVIWRLNLESIPEPPPPYMGVAFINPTAILLIHKCLDMFNFDANIKISQKGGEGGGLIENVAPLPQTIEICACLSLLQNFTIK